MTVCYTFNGSQGGLVYVVQRGSVFGCARALCQFAIVASVGWSCVTFFCYLGLKVARMDFLSYVSLAEVWVLVFFRWETFRAAGI